MPELGESVTEGTVTRWLKQVGDTVELDEPLLEVSTDKVDTEIPSPVAGTLLSITVGEDETVQVGAELAVVGDADQAGQDAGRRLVGRPGAGRGGPRSRRLPRRRLRSRRPRSRRPPAGGPRSRIPPSRETDGEPERAAAGDGASDDGEAVDGEARAPYVTPLVRKLAAENGVDLSTLSGSGVGGRIRKQDVLAAAEKAAARAKEQEKEQAAPARPAAAASQAPERRPLPTPARAPPSRAPR